MQMKDIIRAKRKECGYTQEQVASYLGVSAPAVNKWESGATFPDVALLSPLARLLQTDVNTLLCFQENLTKEDITSYSREVSRIAQEKGISNAIEKVQALIKEYPSCAELLYQMAMVLIGLPMINTCSSEERNEMNTLSAELLKRVSAAENCEYANRARYMLASQMIQEEEYDQAIQLIEKMPYYNGMDKQQLEILLYMKKRNAKEAGKLLERKLNQLIQEVFLHLNNLAISAVWENDSERAEKLAEYAKKLMEIYGWDYSGYTVAMSVAAEEKDTDKCIELLKIMLSCLEKPIDVTDSVLYAHLRKEEPAKENSGQENNPSDSLVRMAKQMREALLAAVKKDEQFAFLREKYSDVVSLLEDR